MGGPNIVVSTGDRIKADNASWSFAGDVAKNFDDHVSKSVPQYLEGHGLVVDISDFFLQRGSVCYEIGASTGALIEKVALHNKSKKIKAIGIDVEKDMVAFARKKCAKSPVSFLHGDVSAIELEKADLIIAYYTIQFIPPKRRQEVINQIYEALNWGGAFVMFEKVRACDARFQDILTSMYLDYKLRNGYTPEEVLAKMRSLKGILEPFSTQGNLDLMERAGFKDVISVMTLEKSVERLGVSARC